MRDSPSRVSSRLLSIAAPSVLIVFACLTLFDVFFVPIEKDEGVYAYAFRLVAEGKIPYRDFTYIESPALPYYYASILALPGITLLSVRILCALTGLVGLLILVRIAQQRAGPTAAAIAGLILFSNPYLAEWFSRDVTYPLVTLLLALTIWVDSAPVPRTTRAAAEGILLALVSAVKASMGIVALVWMGFRLWRFRREPRPLAAGLCGFAGGLAISVATFWVADPAAFLFNVLEASMSRGRLFRFMSRPDPMDQWLEFGWGQKILAARTIILWNAPLVLLALLVLFLAGSRYSAGKDVFGKDGRGIGLALGAGVLFHLLVPSPAYPNYLFMLLPVLALPVAARYATWVQESRGSSVGMAIAALPVLVGLLHLLSGVDPGRLGLEIGSWRHGPERDLTELVTRTVSPEGFLLTDYMPVAVSSNRRVVPGSEGGRASWVLTLSNERAAAVKVLNRSGFLAVLRDGRVEGVVLTSHLFDDSFSLEENFIAEVEAALAARYELVREFPASVYFEYGRIRVFHLRPESAAQRISRRSGRLTSSGP